MSTPTFQLTEDLIDRVTASVSADTRTYTNGSGLTYMSLSSPTTVTSTLSPNAAVSGAYTMSSNTTATAPWFTKSTATPKINLDGEGADIVVNGHSLVDAINSIKDRLNCLQINPALEKEWDQLRALGDQYRELEQQILDKQATWNRLTAMPAPDID
jgi:hypothetical protein